MLILQLRQRNAEDEVIIRDADGRIICVVGLGEIRGDKARLSFIAPHQIHLNRRSVDDTKKWPVTNWPDTPATPICAVCKCPLHAVDDDGTGAHRVCAEREKSS